MTKYDKSRFWSMARYQYWATSPKEVVEIYKSNQSSVEPAEDNELKCNKCLAYGCEDAPICGGKCIRKYGHDGLCLCQGDYDNIPGNCPSY